MRLTSLIVSAVAMACSDSPPPGPEHETPVVATVAVTPATTSIVAGTTVQLTATPKDGSGTTITGRTTTWASLNQNVALVSTNGLVSGVAAGTATITATIDGKQGSATVTVTAPPPLTLTSRVGHSMAYDEARHQLLLFGGAGTEGPGGKADRNSLWAWNGITWTLVGNGGPPGRRLASMTYDASRQRVVLYAGQNGEFPNGTIFTDTWEWDGAAWTKRADAGPPSRVHQSIAYDRVRGRVVLYGGFSIGTQTEFRDIWEWAGSSWTLSPVSTSAGSIARGIEHDEKTGTMMLFSVLANALVVDRYDGSAVTRVPVAPPCIPSLLANFGTAHGILLYSASCGTAEAPQSWIWNGTAWTQVQGTQPPFRLGSAMAYDRDRDRVVLFGGEVAQGVPDLADTWEFDGSAWVKRSN